MTQTRVYKAIGLMSGTSLDGIDVGLIETDGQNHVMTGATHYLPYDEVLKERIRACFGKTEQDELSIAVERDITLLHAQAVRAFIQKESLSDVRVVGFHGQTITHKPKEGFTWQLGDGALLAKETGIDVVNNFRVADVAKGGQGAPLIPLYHQALARQKNIKLPVVFLNIGGVANVTWIGEDQDHLLAFDTGPGNALMDDYMKVQFAQSYDKAGEKAKLGTPNDAMIAAWLSHSYLDKVPPKSLDRGFLPEKGKTYTNADMNEWNVAGVWDLSPKDAMATLAHFTAASIAAATKHFPTPAHEFYVCGGGRHNAFLMDLIAQKINAPVRSINELGYNGDSIEAEGFAYLAMRHLNNLPLSLPTTTGVALPTLGGEFHAHSDSE